MVSPVSWLTEFGKSLWPNPPYYQKNELSFCPANRRLRTTGLIKQGFLRNHPNSHILMFRFKLRSLLVVIAVAAIGLALVVQTGMSNAQFEFIENDLAVDSQGLIHGKIRWSFTGDQPSDDTPIQYVCSVKNLKLNPGDLDRLLQRSAGETNDVRYRSMALGPLKKQDPFKYYINNQLGIDADFIVGYVWFDGWVEVVINGM